MNYKDIGDIIHKLANIEIRTRRYDVDIAMELEQLRQTILDLVDKEDL